MHTYTHTYIYIYTHTHRYIYIYMNRYVHTDLFIWFYVYVYTPFLAIHPMLPQTAQRWNCQVLRRRHPSSPAWWSGSPLSRTAMVSRYLQNRFLATRQRPGPGGRLVDSEAKLTIDWLVRHTYICIHIVYIYILYIYIHTYLNLRVTDRCTCLITLMDWLESYK